MKKVKIIYNPFQLTTVITVDGQEPAENSSLDFQKQRLQEWAEKLPKILFDEYRDKNISIEFTGTLDDFTDLKEILMANNCQINFSEFQHHKTPDVEEVENEVINIYDEIKEGPVEALKDEDIRNAFEAALDSEFAINVVATMSSGKSSLINSLLGVNLMPVAQMATTATIVRIIYTPQEGFSGIAFDSNDEEVYREENLTLGIMDKWNSDNRISTIDIYGPIPCVDSVGMRLVLIDTPGPNNSRDKNHKKLTYEMLAESEKSLVLFIMNATALNIDNEAEFLDYVCKCMKEGGKQSRDRFIFAVNKLDTFRPKNNDKVLVALNSVIEGLDERDIIDPNIFPVSALAALEIRTQEEEPEAIGNFSLKCKKGDEFHFEKYYEFNHLPLSSRKRVSNLVLSGEEDAELELHTGIPSIEEAIRLYVNKYARTIKVRDLVNAFNKRLIELNAEAELMERIRINNEEKKRLEDEITSIQREIESGHSAKEYASLIDSIDVSKDVEQDINNLIGDFHNKIDENFILKFSNDTKVAKDKALRDVKKIKKEATDLQAQLEVQVNKIFEYSFKRTYDRIMNLYREKLIKLGYKAADNSFKFNPLDLVGEPMADIDKFVEKKTKTVNEGHNETKYRTVQGERKTNWFWEPWNWGSERYEEIQEEYEVFVDKYVDYVNMSEVVNDYVLPIQNNLIKVESKMPETLHNLAKSLKENLKNELMSVDNLLKAKLQDVKDRMNTASQTATEISKQQEQLEWMREIIARVNKLTNY